MTPDGLIAGLLVDAVWSGIAAAGFAILFNVPRRLLPGCTLAGAAGHVMRTLLMGLGLSTEMATLAGSTLVGLVSLFLSRRLDAPLSIFAVAGAIPLVPGAFAYRTMIAILNAATASGDASGPLLIQAGVNAIRTGLALGAIAFGIAAPTLLFMRPKPIP
jgi:uncharacterized membrane protein YjjB (DUF3815 family)